MGSNCGTHAYLEKMDASHELSYEDGKLINSIIDNDEEPYSHAKLKKLKSINRYIIILNVISIILLCYGGVLFFAVIMNSIKEGEHTGLVTFPLVLFVFFGLPIIFIQRKIKRLKSEKEN